MEFAGFAGFGDYDVEFHFALNAFSLLPSGRPGERRGSDRSSLVRRRNPGLDRPFFRRCLRVRSSCRVRGRSGTTPCQLSVADPVGAAHRFSASSGLQISDMRCLCPSSSYLPSCGRSK
jgi:hypothetical protein